MKILRKTVFALGLLPLVLLVSTPANATAGKFIFVHGPVKVVTATQGESPARRGMDVDEGARVITGAGGTAQLRMKDGALLAVRPETTLEIEAYAFRETGREESSIVNLLKGSFRSVTGAIGRENQDAYQVKTPVATIGIRGTDHEPAYIPPGSPVGKPGAYDKVNSGRTILRTDAGVIEIGPNQIGYAGNRSAAPVLTPEMPDLYAGFGDEDSGEEQEATETEETSGSEAAPEESGEEATEETEADESAQEATGAAESESGDVVDEGGTETAEGGAVQTETTSDQSSGETATVSTSTSDATGTVAPATTADAPLTTTEATLSSGETLNLTDATLTSADGEVVVLSEIVSAIPPLGGQAVGSWVGSYDGWISGRTEPLGHTPEDVIYYDTDGNLVEVVYGEYDNHLSRFRVVNARNGTRGRANSYALTGIQYGRMRADSVILNFGDGSSETTDLANGGHVHWIAGPAAFPEYLPMVFRGTVNYTKDGGTAPTDLFGNSGTLNNASMTVDFSKLLVDFYLKATVNSYVWIASGSGLEFDYDEFWGGTWNGNINVTVNGYPAEGGVEGRIGGEGMSGAMMSYSLFENSMYNAGISGVAALTSGVRQDTSIDHRIVLWAGYDPRTSAEPSFNPMLAGGGYNNVNSLAISGSALTRFRGELPEYEPDHVSHEVVRFAYSGSVVDIGTDPATGVMWGRWTGPSNISATYFDGSGPTFNPGNLHYLAGPVMNEPVGLPVSGTYTYSFLGGTRPTDNHGNVGAAPTAADFLLQANFTNMTVDAAARASVGGVTLRGSTTGIPLESNHFGAGFDEPNKLAVTCSAGCATGDRLQGTLMGGFGGTTGEVAGMAYSFRKHPGDGSIGTVISGVAAFKR